MLEPRLNQLLGATASVKIASSDQVGAPWVAAAYFAEEGPFTLRLLIESGGRTLANVRARPNVALMLEDGNAIALFAQADARAQVVEGAEEQFRDAIAAKTPASAPLVGLPGLVPVKLTVDRWRLTDVSAGWMPGRELARPADPG